MQPDWTKVVHHLESAVATYTDMGNKQSALNHRIEANRYYTLAEIARMLSKALQHGLT